MRKSLLVHDWAAVQIFLPQSFELVPRLPSRGLRFSPIKWSNVRTKGTSGTIKNGPPDKGPQIATSVEVEQREGEHNVSAAEITAALDRSYLIEGMERYLRSEWQGQSAVICDGSVVRLRLPSRCGGSRERSGRGGRGRIISGRRDVGASRGGGEGRAMRGYLPLDAVSEVDCLLRFDNGPPT